MLPEQLAEMGPRAKLVYLYVERVWNATVDELKDVLGIPLLALLSTIRRLVDAGLVRRLDESPDTIVVAA